MKTKSKLLLGLTAALAASVGVASTATFAWFTTTRTASVNFTSTSVYSTKGNLAIAYSAIAYGGTTGSVAGNIATVNANTEDVTDISGDGLNFYRPNWIPGGEGYYANNFSTIHNGLENGVATTYFVTFNITLTNNGSGDLDAYLDTGSDVYAYGSKLEPATNTSKDNDAAAGTRVAIYEGSTLKSLWHCIADTNGYHYLKSTAGGDAYGAVTGGVAATTNYSLETLTDSGLAASTFHAGKFTTPVAHGFTNQSGQSLGSITAGSSIVLTVVIWLEGTATTSTNNATHNAVGGKVAVDLAIAAVDPA